MCRRSDKSGVEFYRAGFQQYKWNLRPEQRIHLFWAWPFSCQSSGLREPKRITWELVWTLMYFETLLESLNFNFAYICSGSFITSRLTWGVWLVAAKSAAPNRKAVRVRAKVCMWWGSLEVQRSYAGVRLSILNASLLRLALLRLRPPQGILASLSP